MHRGWGAALMLLAVGAPAACEPAGHIEDGPLVAAGCAPKGGPPTWIEEGNPVRISVSCVTGASGSLGWRASGLPRGAAFDAETATLMWTPGLDQAGVYAIT